MEILSTIISVAYYLLIAFIIFLIIRNMVKSRDWKEELLYIIILLPFLLRLLLLK